MAAKKEQEDKFARARAQKGQDGNADGETV